MKIELARHVAHVAFRSSADLNELLPLLRDHCDEREYRDYLALVSAVSGQIAHSILQRIYTEHPDVEVEIDRRIAEYGMLIRN